MLAQVVTIALGVLFGLLAFTALAGIVAAILFAVGLIGQHRKSEARIREQARRDGRL